MGWDGVKWVGQNGAGATRSGRLLLVGEATLSGRKSAGLGRPRRGFDLIKISFQDNVERGRKRRGSLVGARGSLVQGTGDGAIPAGGG